MSDDPRTGEIMQPRQNAEALESEAQAAPEQSPLRKIFDMIDGNKALLSAACGDGPVTYESVRATFWQAAFREPRIFDCAATEEGRRSVMIALVQACKLGIDPLGMHNGASFQIYKVRDKSANTEYATLQLQLGFNALIELMLRGSEVLSVIPEVVYEGEDFTYYAGTENRIVHVVDHEMRSSLTRDQFGGKIVGAYAAAFYNSGHAQIAYVDTNYISIARESSKMSGGPWKKNPAAMAKKTAIRQLAKYLVLDRVAKEAVKISDDLDGANFDGENRRGGAADTDMAQAMQGMSGPGLPEISEHGMMMGMLGATDEAESVELGKGHADAQPPADYVQSDEPLV